MKIGARLLNEFCDLGSIERVALELGDVSKMGKKEKQCYDAKVLRGLKLVQNHVLSSSHNLVHEANEKCNLQKYEHQSSQRSCWLLSHKRQEPRVFE